MTGLKMKLENIKQHSLYPFLDFRTNDESFSLLQQFWAAVVKEALGETLAKTCIPIMDADREDGNPILFFWLPQAKRAIQVLIHENQDNVPLAKKDNHDAVDVYLPLVSFFGTCSTSYSQANPETIDKIMINYDMQYDEYLDLVIHHIHTYLCEMVSEDKIEMLERQRVL